MKDYYQILECTPISSREEIKRQYRKLALQYHPDRNQDNQYAAARFHDIREAYETLTNPERKEAWLQERWLRQAMNIKTVRSEPLTPYLILQKVLALDRQVAMQDVFRMDQTRIAGQIMELASEENISCLLEAGDTQVNTTIVQYLMSCTRPLQENFLSELWPKLEKIAAGDKALIHEIRKFRENKKRRHARESLTLPLVMLFTVALCLMIWLMGR